MAGLGLSVGINRHFHRTQIVGSLTNVSAPTITGGVVVGQTLHATHGTYSLTPDSYTVNWYLGGTPISGETGDTLLVLDSYAGLAIGYDETAHKSGYTDPAANAATNTAAVAAIDLTNAITSVTRTSASGVTPMTADIAFGSNVYEGYILDRIVYTDSGLTTYKNGAEYNSLASHVLTHADLQSGATIDWSADGGPSIAATDWVQYRVRTTSPNAVGYHYTYGTAISPTDAVVAMVWSTTDHGTGITVSGGGLTASASIASGCPSVRTNRPYTTSGTGKFYHEHHATNSNLFIAVADAGAGMDTTPANELFGGGAPNSDEAVYWKNGYTDYNGTSTSGYPTFTDGDGIDQAVDVAAKKVWWRVASADGASAGSWLPSGDPALGTGGLSLSAMTGNLYPAMAFANGGNVTARFSAASFVRTPPTGFSAP